MTTSSASSGHPLSRRQNTATELSALGLGALAFTVVAVAALVVFRWDDAPITGPGSLGAFASLASAITAALAFAAGRYALHRQGRTRIAGVLDVVDVAAMAFAHGIIALLGWTLAATIMAQSFIGATVYAMPILVLGGAAAAVSAYVAFLSATHMDAQLLAIVLATFLALGVIASMLTADDPRWWEENLSSLGITSDVSALAFNLTLIIAGFLLTVLARYATRAIPTAAESSVGRVRTTLVLIGVFLGCVGIFKVDSQFWIHTGVASGMAIAFAVMTIRLKAWIPGISRAFLPVGWLFFAVIFVLAVLFGTGYYTLTAVELVAGVLIFAWIILFLRTVGALDADVGGRAADDPA